MRTTTLLLFLLIPWFFSACSKAPVVPSEKQAGTYFQEGEAFFEEGRYKDAIASWEKVRDSYYSPELNILAELKIAEAHFLAEQYVEAAVAYEEFINNNPEHPQIPHALYQLGLSYYNQVLNHDQDQTATLQALNAFRTLQQRFPQDPRKEEVQAYIDRCLNLLAANELYIGQYYLKNDYYHAAVLRFEGILKRYPNYYQRDKVYFFLGQAYLKNGQRDEAMAIFNRLFKEFPGSEHAISAQKFIEENY